MTFILAAALLFWSMIVQPNPSAHDHWWHLLAFAAVLLLMDVAGNVSRIARKLCDDKKRDRSRVGA